MIGRLAHIFRHPIKAIGREEIASVTLAEGETLPGDRIWAVAHEASNAVDGEWGRCSGFVRAASSPKLMAVTAQKVDAGYRLKHPERPDIVIDPDTQGGLLVDWVAPLIADGRAAATRVVQAPNGRGMTDTSAPSITLGNLTSHKIVEQKLGRPVSIHRWRANLWIDGMAPWEEFDLVGKTLKLGGARLEAYKRIERCEATSANPDTGQRDADLLSILETMEHRDFTIGLKVVQGGVIARGDALEVA